MILKSYNYSLVLFLMHKHVPYFKYTHTVSRFLVHML